MLIRRLLMISLLLSPWLASAHNFVGGQPVKPIVITDRGELLLDNRDTFSYRTGIAVNWQERCALFSILPGENRQKEKRNVDKSR